MVSSNFRKPVIGDVLLKFFALLNCRLARRFDGRRDLLAKQSQPLFVTEEGEPITVGVIFAAELPQQFVCKLHVVLGEARIVAAIQIGNGVLGGAAQGAAHALGHGQQAVGLDALLRWPDQHLDPLVSRVNTPLRPSPRCPVYVLTRSLLI